MIRKVKLTEKEISELHAKGASLNPHTFDLEKISHSGIHVAEVVEE